MTFQNKTIILTGASDGIGKGLALSLAQQGANLVLAARNPVALEETATLCNQQGGTALSVPTDVTQPAECERLIETAIATFGQIDSLVNNAGISLLSPFDQVTDLSVFERVMQVNYLGAVYCTHYALPHLKHTQGLLVAVSSLCGKTGVPTRTGYVASKHAMQGFFDTLRIELRGTGVDVLVVSPGFVATRIRERAIDGNGQLLGQSPRNEERGTMSVDECVHQIIEAMKKRKREHLMTLRGKVIPWARLLVPGLVDQLVAAATNPNKH